MSEFEFSLCEDSVKIAAKCIITQGYTQKGMFPKLRILNFQKLEQTLFYIVLTNLEPERGHK
jgi:hypothetical protein